MGRCRLPDSLKFLRYPLDDFYTASFPFTFLSAVVYFLLTVSPTSDCNWDICPPQSTRRRYLFVRRSRARSLHCSTIVYDFHEQLVLHRRGFIDRSLDPRLSHSGLFRRAVLDPFPSVLAHRIISYTRYRCINGVCIEEPQVPSHALTNRDVKQMSGSNCGSSGPRGAPTHRRRPYSFCETLSVPSAYIIP